MLMVIMIMVPALLLNLGLLTPGIARAHGSASRVSPRSPVIVNSAVKHDVSPPLRSIKPVHTAVARQHPLLHLPKIRQGAPNGLHDYVQHVKGASAILSTSNSFDGVGNGFTGPAGTFTVNGAPPDANGAVGPNHYVQTVNVDFAIFNKVGSVLYGPVQINTLWSGFGGPCEVDNDGSPVVVYDSIADPWVISQFAISSSNPYYQCVALSTTGDPTGTYYRYAFSYSSLPDSPKLGLWPDAYYATFNMFASGTTFQGAQVCAYDRVKMLSGQNATQQCFSTDSSFGGLLPSSLDGSRLPPTGSPNYVLGLGTDTSSLALWKVHVDWTNPANSTFSGPTSFAVASYTPACGSGGTCIPQAGTTTTLDSLSDRLMYRLAYRNFGSYESLVVAHAVTSGSSVGMRWYEIRSPGTPTLFQQGTYAPDSNYRWMGSIAQDQTGDMAMGFSISSSSIHPSIGYTGRLASDSPGIMTQGETTLIAGGGSQTSGLTRWGEYTSMSVDPSDDCTFWYTNEYLPSDGSFNWKTRIGSFKFPGCGTPANDFSISANPTSLSITRGSSGTSTINTSVTGGSAGTVSLTASVTPSGPTASLNPTSVTAGTSSTLTVSVGSSVPAGTYTVAVAGTEGSISHSTSVTVTVTADTTPPVLSLPGDMTVNATGPQGAVVTYSASSSDDDGTHPPVTCTPASGSTFPIGTTTVNCSATDAAGNTATGSFKVTVKGADQQIGDLVSLVNSFHFSYKIQLSLDTELQVAASGVKAGKNKIACAALDLFIGEVKALTGKGITVNQADQLIANATRIKAVVGC